MARRRYISTTTSTDKVVNKLATKHGDFATLLYLLMIPHAEDDGTLTGDPEELLAVVLPMRRDKDENDVAEALEAMSALGLVEWDKERCLILFPAESFYRYQTYIKPVNRRCFTEQNNEESKQSAQDSEQQRKTPQNAASHSLPLPHSPSVIDNPQTPTGGETLVADATEPEWESDLIEDEEAIEPHPIPETKPVRQPRSDSDERARELFAAFREVRHPKGGAVIPAAEWKSHRNAARALVQDGATPEQIRSATGAMLRRWGDLSKCTFPSLVRNWTALLEPDPMPRSNGFHSVAAAPTQARYREYTED